MRRNVDLAIISAAISIRKSAMRLDSFVISGLEAVRVINLISAFLTKTGNWCNVFVIVSIFAFQFAVLLASDVNAQASGGGGYVPEAPRVISTTDRNGFDYTNGGFLRTISPVSIGDLKNGGLELTIQTVHRYEQRENGYITAYARMNHWKGAARQPNLDYYLIMWGYESASFYDFDPLRGGVNGRGYAGSDYAPYHYVQESFFDRNLTILSSDERMAVYGRPNPSVLIITADGRRIKFNDNLHVDRIEYPNGIEETYHYAQPANNPYAHAAILKAVTTNAGYMLHFQYDAASNQPTYPSRVVGINTSVYDCPPLSEVCSVSQGGDWPYVDLHWYDGLFPSQRLEKGLGELVPLASYTNGHGQTAHVYPEERSAADPDVVDFSVSLSNYSGFFDYNAIINGEPWTYNYIHWAYDVRNCSGYVDGPQGYSASWTCTRNLDPLPDVWGHDDLIVPQITEYTVNGRTVRCEPDCNYRPRRIERPGELVELFEYDNAAFVGDPTLPMFRARNVTSHVLSPNNSTSTIVRNWSYVPDTPANRYDAFRVFNKPVSYTGPRGHTSDYSYYAAHGGINTIRLPASGRGQYGAIRPTTTFSYSHNAAGIYNPSQSITCARSASCPISAPDAIVTQWSYTSPHAQVRDESRLGAGGATSITTSYTYTAQGDLEAIDGPLNGTADTKHFVYDRLRRLIAEIGPDPDGSGPDRHLVTRYAYNADGLVTRTDTGVANNPSSWNTLSVTARVRTAFDGYSRPTRRETINIGGPANGQVGQLTQINYDGLQRVRCTAVRMNPAAFNLGLDACALGPVGAFGADRITRNEYTAQGDLWRVIRGLGTSSQITYQTYAYHLDGMVRSVTDARGNLTRYEYDSFNRLSRTRFPSPTTPGTASASDYEAYGYDAAGNRTSLRKRDGRTIGFSYDFLNRITRKNLPSGERDVFYDYDVLGLQISAVFDSASGPGIKNTYDSFGRLVATTNDLTGWALEYQYDAAGNRTRFTHDDGVRFDYQYDVASRLSQINEPFAGWINRFHYDTRSRLSSISHRNRMTWSLGYDSLSRIDTLSIDATAGTSRDLTSGYLYTPSGQLNSRTLSNSVYALPAPALGTDIYQTNGLNQYTSVAGANLSYDANGNMTALGSRSYTYDSENRLITAPRTGGGAATLRYDPHGRLYEIVGSTTTRFVYDGDALVAELNGSGAINRRYVHGPGMDMPLIWYEGAGVSDGVRRHLARDHQGSIIAIAPSSIAVPSVNTYDSFGQPGENNSGRFSYTGQIMLPEVDLLHFKARVYSPEIGRFLQTDPIGYEDQMNMYAYVHNDPMNLIDPTGQDTVRVRFADQVIYTDSTRSSSIPQWLSNGHSGLVVINDQTGLTRYRQYGRYPGAGPVPGAVDRSTQIPNLRYQDGVPSAESLTSLYSALLDIGERNGSGDLRLTWRPNSDDFDSMMEEVDRWDREVAYSVSGRRTCHDFCGSVSNAGGSRRGMFRIRLNEDNVEDAVERTIEEFGRLE